MVAVACAGRPDTDAGPLAPHPAGGAAEVTDCAVAPASADALPRRLPRAAMRRAPVRSARTLRAVFAFLLNVP